MDQRHTHTRSLKGPFHAASVPRLRAHHRRLHGDTGRACGVPGLGALAQDVLLSPEWDGADHSQEFCAMLTEVVRIALSLEVLLVCVEGVVPAARAYLPLGASHLAQLGAVLGLAVTAVDLWQALASG
jgi:hypothetical protein